MIFEVRNLLLLNLERLSLIRLKIKEPIRSEVEDVLSKLEGEGEKKLKNGVEREGSRPP
jgi:uncharacterized membrane protein YgaE (UPF0421/DUF939 family)